jgi:hypothetical protein
MQKKPTIKITIHTIMHTFNLSIKEVSDQFGIPYRTVQNWAGGVSAPPNYILIMMYNSLDMIKLNQINDIIINELMYKIEKASDYLHDDRPAEAMSVLDN